ncbi:TIGR01777 family oxidoreductase [Streptomyces thioluteus]|uniref:TIGR01777 family oxidoreductase n=1 Tax=Streptomyces thioluteus TaxID=66431 RepID=A0ABN3WMN5_STRTU
MRIAITGSSGLIGSALVRSLEADGHRVTRLVRRAPRSADEVRWEPLSGRLDPRALAGCAAVVHLAGAGIGDHRWTAAYREEIRDSRVLGTTAVAKAVAEAAAAPDAPPAVLVSASAIGIYGDGGSEALDEDSPSGEGFLADVCREWEAAAAPAAEAGVRTVLARTGLVVSRHGGAWKRLFPLFRLGLGGPLGNGRQYWSFIALHDHVAALRHALATGTLSGPVNLTAPLPVTNREVARVMGRVLHRPALLPAPAPALRLALGGMAADVLASQRVLPGRLLGSGFEFAYPDVESAVRAALAEEGHASAR